MQGSGGAMGALARVLHGLRHGLTQTSRQGGLFRRVPLNQRPWRDAPQARLQLCMLLAGITKAHASRPHESCFDIVDVLFTVLQALPRMLAIEAFVQRCALLSQRIKLSAK